MRAEEAYRISKENYEKNFKEIFDRIKSAALEGKFSVSFFCKGLTNKDLSIIGHKGYTLKADSGNIIIDWSEAGESSHEKS